MLKRLLNNRAARLLQIAIGALCLLQHPGCGGDAERKADVSSADSGVSGDGAISVTRIEVPSREVQPPSRVVVDSTPAAEAPAEAVLEAPNLGGVEPDPRLTQTLDPEASARRLEEISKLNAAGDDLESVLDALESDPDPAVRVAAADLLAESERREAIDGLLRALDDPSREVVVQALQTLSLVGDSDIIPRIEPLLDHPDPEISGPAVDTIYFVSDGDDESDPDYGKDFGGLPESDRDPAAGFTFEFGAGDDREE